MENEKRRIVIKWLLITLLILAIVGVIVYLIVERFGPTTQVVSVQVFSNDLLKAAESPSDKIFIQSVQADEPAGTITYILKSNNSVITRVVNTSREIAGSLFNPNNINEIHPFLTNNKSITVDSVISYENIKPAELEAIKALNFIVIGFRNNEPSFIVRLIYAVLPSLLFLLIMWWIWRAMMRRNMNMMGAVGDDKNPAQKIKSDKMFKDIAGNKEAIEEISEIVDYLKNPKKYETAGARMPHGILLGGPPGTGKTLLAKATAGEANVPFYFISASNFVEMYVGLGAKRVRTVVEEARKNAPAIIFIDELDAIGRTRGSGIGGGHDEREQTLNQLLVEMDGMKENNGLLFFAATNRTDVLDPALTRPGRFDRTITVGLPDVKERAEILKLHATGKRISPLVQLDQVAKRTPGYSGAQLENVINEASLLAVRRNSEVIDRDDIDEAIDRVMAGPAKKNRVITKSELTMVAYHEAGHAVVGIKMPGANKVQKITIIPRGMAGGYNLMTPEEEKYNLTKKELIAIITSYMGGRAAEEIIYGKDNVSTGASDDFQKATKLARKMVTEWGMSSLGPIKYEEEEGSPFLGRDYLKSSHVSAQIAYEIDIEVRKIITEAEENAHRIINENRELHELIKTALLQKETIVAEEIEYISKNLKLPPEKEEIETPKSDVTLDSLLS
ncbi:ATPase, AAA family [Mycoplasmopsis maculosa]|uniref:ATP-dependent zinc metalloprotease FtsH n=1 Tax=Mycoplasmopsis maculosa TaxID=114885 RepID=A0A449B4W9_9BACT|nr:ATP-dependent zinc metalloprotease FtsH [Mycoplasmopsis maculosa]VEU75616.1 ATPase, AAA family [Mycoplasmopsis maculosa]